MENTEKQQPKNGKLPIHGVISRDSEVQKIEQVLNELREMRDKHKFEDGYRSYYNTVCDRLDVLHSKLLHGL